MGKRSSIANDEAVEVQTGSFSATGTSTARAIWSDFNIALWGTFVGTVAVERSFDGGTTFLPVARDTSGTAATFTAPTSLSISEPERGVLYRLNCTAYTSGTINYRLSQ
ncbi:MAG TPA: hypothetical protein VF920_02455 [Dongiaceae bacterium]